MSIKAMGKGVVMQNVYENFTVNQMNCTIAYDFEYLGNLMALKGVFVYLVSFKNRLFRFLKSACDYTCG